MNDFAERSKCTMAKFVDCIQVGGKARGEKCMDHLQKEIGRSSEWHKLEN